MVMIMVSKKFLEANSICQQVFLEDIKTNFEGEFFLRKCRKQIEKNVFFAYLKQIKTSLNSRSENI